MARDIAQKGIFVYTMGSMQKIVANGSLVNYSAYLEQNSGPAVLFLHGWRSEAAVWNQSVRLLRQAGLPNGIYALDLPGFGLSPAPTGTWGVSDYCQAVEEFVSKLQLGRVVLVGHSFGGRVAIKLAATRPELVERLVLVDSAGFAMDGERKKALNRIAALAKPFFKPKFMQPLRRSIYKGIGADDYLATPELQKTYVRVISEDLSGDLPRIKAPTLLIWGANDQDTPLGYAERMRSAIAGSRLETIVGAGHFSFLDKSEEFVRIIKGFINESQD